MSSNDTSRIVGTVVARVDAPRAGDIPWLLLSTKSVGPDGHFSGITSIQRIHTVGGSAPAANTCHERVVGLRTRVDYTAIYRRLYGRN